MKANLLSMIVLVSLLLSACQSPSDLNHEVSSAEVNLVPVTIVDLPQTEPADKGVENADPLEEEQNQSAQTEIPNEPLEEVLNPLTGLPVRNPENLALPPALVSVTNFPSTARPQAGLSFSPLVFEIFIGDGMTRFLALFYGDYPQAVNPDQAGGASEDMAEGVPQPTAEIGPVRSGRLPYEYIRKLFNGFIVMASAYSKVAAQIDEYVNVYGSDTMDVNSALIPVEKLEDIARANQEGLGEMNLSGMSFDT